MNFIIDQWKHGLKKMIYICIQLIMKENLLLLKDLLESSRIEFINTWWLQYQNFYIDKLDDIVNKYNSTYHSTIKMKPVDVKSSTYVDPSKEINNKSSRFKISDIVRITKNKNLFAKGHVCNWSEEVSVIKNVKNTVPRTYVIANLKGEETVGTF